MKKNSEKVLLRDNVVKKILNSEDTYCREYVTRLISLSTGIDYDVLKDNIELVHNEVSNNVNTVDSMVDSLFRTDDYYFNIEINYNYSEKALIKNNTYIYICYIKTN